jgi:hypothetical protein
MNIKLKPVLVLVTDRYGDVIYPAPVKMMRDHIGLSQRQMAKQATRDKMPRDVSASVQCPVADTKKAGLLRRMIDAGLRLARSRL